MTTLHSGGKFGAKVYQTAGGLHGVGLSVVNALAEELTVEVARNRQLWRQSYVRGRPTRPARAAARQRQPARHHGALQARSRDLRPRPAVPAGAGPPHGAQQGLPVPRRRDPLAVRSRAARRRPGRARARGVPFPRRARGLPQGDARRARVRDRAGLRRRGRAQRRLRPGRMGDRLAARRGALRRALLQHRADALGRRPRAGAAQRAGARAARLRRAHRQQQARRAGHRRRPARQRLRAALAVHPEPAVPGPDQGEAGRARGRPPGRADAQGPLRPLALGPRRGRQRLARPRGDPRRGAPRAQALEGGRAQDRDPQAAPAGQARRLHDRRPRGHRDLPGRGRFGRRLGQAGAGPRDPGDPPVARQDPQRGQRDLGQAARQQGARRSRDRARLRHRQGLPRGRAALRQGRHHDRCRRRRRPYRRAADDLLLPRDAAADRGRPPLPRAAALVPHRRRRRDRLRPRRGRPRRG